MIRSTIFASGRSRVGRPVVVFHLVLGLAVAACNGPPGMRDGPAVLELDGDTVTLPAGTAIAEVVLRSGADPIEPDTVRLRPGDVVRFTAADALNHAVAFDLAQVAPEGVAFLERTVQRRSPPLLAAGARWIVSFVDGPPGAYPFTDIASGAGGVVLVLPSQAADTTNR